MDEVDKMKNTVEGILDEVLADNEFDDDRAQVWTKAAQQKVAESVTKDGFKVVVMCETLSPGAGCVKQQFSLQTADDRCFQVTRTNSKGVTMCAFIVANAY
eukprot:TRINITY_DN236_c0_g2_i1.p3 TRINITY_DN236_c0_g2~~TRINITY_DN236_c0_g2_i1.p3  ORF type:complete len:101 (+),score=24.49 TRINITY_DN236_c0_g2_i1:68-370(+)